MGLKRPKYKRRPKFKTTPWSCSNCAAENDGKVPYCWKCGRDNPWGAEEGVDEL